MKISFPHMGNLSIALASAIRVLGGELVVPSYNSRRTLSLGTANSPESVCLPYKLILGNYIEAAEAGAEAILMLDSPGICRLGQYSNSARTALRDMGYDIEFINFDLYKGKLREVYHGFKRATGNGNPVDLIRAINLALVKIDYLDQLDHILAYYRAREIQPGSADIKYRKSVKAIDEAMSIKECKSALRYSRDLLAGTPIDKNKKILHVDLTGEIFVVIDRFSNLEVEKELGRLGVHVHRKLNLSNWTNTFLYPSILKMEETHEEKAHRFAKEFLRRDIGGDAIESIGDTAIAGFSKSDGIIHLLPFTCMPEIIAQNILPNVRNEKDIPVLSLVLDEHQGKAGFITRLEAYVDLLKRRKRKLYNIKIA
jgi:predicted nucleotide-binding protein (sugar kinase/HSP70/actin superfamily)